VKKSQFDIIPLIFFLIFIFFFIVLGLVIYLNYWVGKVKEHKEYLTKIAYFTLGEQVASLPYLNCGRINEKFSCFDYYKIRGFKDLLKNNDELDRIIKANLFKFGQKRVVIKVIFDVKNDKQCKNLPSSFGDLNCGYYILYDEKRQNFNIVQKRDVLKLPLLIRYKNPGNPNLPFEYKVGLLVIESYY